MLYIYLFLILMMLLLIILFFQGDSLLGWVSIHRFSNEEPCGIADAYLLPTSGVKTLAENLYFLHKICHFHLVKWSCMSGNRITYCIVHTHTRAHSPCIYCQILLIYHTVSQFACSMLTDWNNVYSLPSGHQALNWTY